MNENNRLQRVRSAIGITVRRGRQAVVRRGRAMRRAIATGADTGMTTAEYAVGTIAAVGFAVVLYKIVRSDAVASMLTTLVRTALHAI